MANISARKNKNGDIVSYRIRVSRGYDNKGNKLKPYEMTYKPDTNMTEKQVEKELNKQAVMFEDKCKQGMIGKDRNIKLSEFCEMYLEIKRDALSPRVYYDYEKVINKLIIPLLGHIKLSDIKSIHIQEFIKYLSGDVKQNRDGSVNADSPKLAQSSIKRKLAVLQSILKQAVKLDMIPSNPANSEKLTLKKSVTPKIEIFTKQETAQMLLYLENEELQFQVLIQLAIMTGARCGELVGLKFSDVNSDTTKITIERSAYKLKGHPIMTKPPKDYEVRTVTVNPYCIELINLLQTEKSKQAETLGELWVGQDWMFTQWNGEIMNPQTPSKQFSKFLLKNGLKHRKFHSLRHTSATLLLYGGVNIKQVQERLGHGDITTTNKYLHYISEADEQAANVLQDMLITKEKKQA